MGNAETAPGLAGPPTPSPSTNELFQRLFLGVSGHRRVRETPKEKAKRLPKAFHFVEDDVLTARSVYLVVRYLPRPTHTLCNGIYGEPHETASLLFQRPYLKMDSSNLQCGHLVSPGPMNFVLSMYVLVDVPANLRRR